MTLSTIEHDSETNSDLKQKLSWISKPSETKILFLSLRQVDLIEGFVQKRCSAGSYLELRFYKYSGHAKMIWAIAISVYGQYQNRHDIKQQSDDKLHYILSLKATNNKKLSCRRQTARRFVSLNISLSHTRSLKVI